MGDKDQGLLAHLPFTFANSSNVILAAQLHTRTRFGFIKRETSLDLTLAGGTMRALTEQFSLSFIQTAHIGVAVLTSSIYDRNVEI